MTKRTLTKTLLLGLVLQLSQLAGALQLYGGVQSYSLQALQQPQSRQSYWGVASFRGNSSQEIEFGDLSEDTSYYSVYANSRTPLFGPHLHILLGFGMGVELNTDSGLADWVIPDTINVKAGVGTTWLSLLHARLYAEKVFFADTPWPDVKFELGLGL